MTKAEREKLAREVRKDLGVYLLFQKPHVRDGHPDADQIAMRCLLRARDDLGTLIAAEQERRAAT